MAADLLHDVLGLGLDGLEGADDLLAKVGLKAESFRTERQGSPSPWERSQSPITFCFMSKLSRERPGRTRIFDPTST